MAQAGFLEQKRVRPGAAAMVILMHGAAIAALLLIKNPVVTNPFDTGTDVILVPIDEPPPPPPPVDRPQPRVETPTVTAVPSPVPIPSPFPVPPSPPTTPPDLGSLSGSRPVEGTPYIPPQPPVERVPDPPRPAPVRVAAEMISGDLQPPYPTSEQRMDREGRVVIRVTIGTDGRVKGAEKVSATSDAFYQATERHARARWRFRPAKVDGTPVEATKTMTVVFTLDG